MRYLYSFLASVFLLSTTFSVDAQELLRHNYKSNGYTYIGSERTLVKAGSSDKHPFYEKLEYVVFPDGETTAYILEIDIEEERSYNFPKEVQLKATTFDGKIHSFKQYAGATTDKHQFTAEDGKTKVYWNVGKYMLEEDDLNRLISGVKYLEIAYSWSPEGFYSYTYSKDEFAQSLKAQKEAIMAAKEGAREIGDVVDYVDNLGSTTVVAKPVSIPGNQVDLTVQMTYLYYKTVNSEDYDITMLLSKGDRKFDVPYESELEFTMEDGSVISLKQERESEDVVYMYPTVDQVKAFAYGKVKSVKIPLSDGSVTVSYGDNEFSEVIATLYNTLQAVSVL